MHSSRVEVNLADGSYTFVPESEEAAHEGEVNALAADQVPQEPEFHVDQEGKPQSMS